MDVTRPHESLTDSALDRELESALGVEPSPEFHARVRTRIASEPEVRPWRLAGVVSAFGRTLQQRAVEPLAAVAIVGIVLAVVVPRLMRDGSPTVKPDVADVRLPALVGEIGPARPTRNTPDRAAVARVASRPDRVEAEVIVSPDEQQALQALLRVAYEGRLPALPEVARDKGIDVSDITITPLVIDRLPQIARLEKEGEGQW